VGRRPKGGCSGPVHCAGDGGGLDSERPREQSQIVLSTMHRVHGREKQMWSQAREQGIAQAGEARPYESIAQEKSDSTWNGSGAKAGPGRRKGAH
jgi:hypothetical protein